MTDVGQLTKEQALAVGESGLWKKWSYRQKAKLQLQQERLFMPFDTFHKAVEKALDREVLTSEFGSGNLLKELCGESPEPSLQEIMDLIPEDKRIMIFPEAHDDH